MNDIIVVAIGGGVGASARFILSTLLSKASLASSFPIATLCVNILGCFIAGALLGLSEKFEFLSPTLRLFLFTGILGGFTTFSAFGLETLTLLKQGAWMSATGYASLSVCFGIVAVWLGALLFRSL